MGSWSCGGDWGVRNFSISTENLNHLGHCENTGEHGTTYENGTGTDGDGCHRTGPKLEESEAAENTSIQSASAAGCDRAALRNSG